MYHLELTTKTYALIESFILLTIPLWSQTYQVYNDEAGFTSVDPSKTAREQGVCI
jgi:hypothetical protein